MLLIASSMIWRFPSGVDFISLFFQFWIRSYRPTYPWINVLLQSHFLQRCWEFLQNQIWHFYPIPYGFFCIIKWTGPSKVINLGLNELCLCQGCITQFHNKANKTRVRKTTPSYNFFTFHGHVTFELLMDM